MIGCENVATLSDIMNIYDGNIIVENGRNLRFNPLYDGGGVNLTPLNHGEGGGLKDFFNDLTSLN